VDHIPRVADPKSRESLGQRFDFVPTNDILFIQVFGSLLDIVCDDLQSDLRLAEMIHPVQPEALGPKLDDDTGFMVFGNG